MTRDSATITPTRATPATTSTGDDSEILHIVAGPWEGFVIDRLARWAPPPLRRAPRALCGVLLDGDPDRPDPAPDSPHCPACVEATGRDLEYITDRAEYVPGYWI